MKEKKEQLFQIARNAQVGMLVTNGTELMARPMALAQDSFDNTFYFLSLLDTTKVDEISENPEVLITFADFTNQGYASVVGNATVNKKSIDISKHFNFIDNAFFENGVETENLCLLEVSLDHAHCWYNERSFFVEAYELFTGFAKGKTTERAKYFEVNS